MIRSGNLDNEHAKGLVNLIAAGDQKAYAEFYTLVSRRALAFIRRMISNEAQADEVLVDTLYDVWRTADKFRGDSLVSTWVLGIARNKALMSIRANSTQGRGYDDIEDHAEVLDSGSPDGFAVLADKEQQDIIQRCLKKLSIKHRECLHMLHFEDLSVSEIAQSLSVPEGTVKSRLSHARAQMADCVSDCKTP